MPIVNSKFKPAWWLPEGHTQTLWASLVRKPARTQLQRERLELPDGDFIDLDWTPPHSGPIVIILHGLQGSSKSNYARGLLTACHNNAWRACVIHFRGCSGEINRLARAYHSGDTVDLQNVINIIHSRYPNTAKAVVGFSLGGNVLLKWLGEDSSFIPLQAAAAVSVPFVLKNGAEKLNSGFSKIYQMHLLRSLKKTASRKAHLLQSQINLHQCKRVNTIFDFDNAVTAPLHGFKDAEDYYSRSSCRPFLKNIRLPTLLIHAKDDPFMTPAVIPKLAELSDSTILELSDTGGHIGYVSGNWPWSATYTFETRLMSFFEDFFK